ncbi:hypothetical protein RKE29_00090 [Streptomyces sp. B1866]|uniref:hypothetical protein n=1 Tax=Streptomyces sp. B1866 TaxID=3075431 RepID=UPI00288E1C2D|nr:hypothetical protein [Streptomyces sp. B1866]MDT3395073.1 hypothetical protein [Streptomyces sp. B1866]
MQVRQDERARSDLGDGMSNPAAGPEHPARRRADGRRASRTTGRRAGRTTGRRAGRSAGRGTSARTGPRTAVTSCAAALVLLAGAAVPARAAAPAREEVCPGVPVPTVASAVPDTRRTEAAVAYAEEPTTGPGHWTGGDGTYSARLPDGDVVWIFSDTFLGQVNPDGSRSQTAEDGRPTPFLNNSFVRTGRGRTTTITGGTRHDPASVLPPRAPGHWYWARDGLVLDGRLNAVYSEFERTGPNSFDFRLTGNVLARFRPDRLSRPESVSPLPSSAGISWGAWLLRDGRHTYVYGVEDRDGQRHPHLARVAGTDLLRPWEYLTADGTWSREESASARLGGAAGVRVSNEFSVVRHGRVYVLVTQDSREPLAAGVDLAYACSPTGPFGHETTAYRAPEGGPFGSYGNPNVYTYNPHEHRELGDRRRLVVSYSVNSFAGEDLYRDASIYRPRFVDITLNPN